MQIVKESGPLETLVLACIGAGDAATTGCVADALRYPAKRTQIWMEGALHTMDSSTGGLTQEHNEMESSL